MAGNNSIQFLRATQSKIDASTQVALAGQPVYATDTNYLYIGDGSTQIKSLPAIKASHADTADKATSATTARQCSTFIKKVKNYIKFRPLIKAFANNFNSLDNLPDMDVVHKFHLIELGDVWLFNKDGTNEVADDSSLDEYKMLKKDKIKDATLDYEIEDNLIKIKEEQLENLCKYGNLFGCGNTMEINSLKRKIENHGSYGGIKWNGVSDDGWIYGEVSSKNILRKLTAYLSIKD